MLVKSLLSAAFGAFSLALMITAAEASPSGLAGTIDQSAGRSGLVEKVTWYGDGYYGRHHRPYYGYRWYPNRHYGYGHYGYRHYGHRWYGHRHNGWYPRYGYRHW
jgi:hypothetical protein